MLEGRIKRKRAQEVGQPLEIRLVQADYRPPRGIKTPLTENFLTLNFPRR